MRRCAVYNPGVSPVRTDSNGMSIGGREFGTVDCDDPVGARVLATQRVIKVPSLPGAFPAEEPRTTTPDPAPTRRTETSSSSAPRRKAAPRKTTSKSSPSPSTRTE